MISTVTPALAGEALQSPTCITLINKIQRTDPMHNQLHGPVASNKKVEWYDPRVGSNFNYSDKRLSQLDIINLKKFLIDLIYI